MFAPDKEAESMSEFKPQTKPQVSWISAELAAVVELDEALRELLLPVHRWLHILAVRNHSAHTLTAYFAGVNQLALFCAAKVDLDTL